VQEVETLRWVLGELERVVGTLREKVEPEPGWPFYSQRDPRWADVPLGRTRVAGRWEARGVRSPARR